MYFFQLIVTYFFLILGFLLQETCLVRARKIICETEDCTQEIKYDLDKSSRNKSPCSNFYDFSCDDWISKTKKPDSEPIWNHWLSLSYKINERLAEILETSDSPHASIQKAQKYFSSCIRTKHYETLYLAELRELLGEFGGWPLYSDSWKGDSLRILETIVNITRFLHAFPVLKFSVDPDYEDTNRNVIYVEAGDTILPRYILQDSKNYNKEMSAYKLWIHETLTHLYPDRSVKWKKSEINRIANLEATLVKFDVPSRNGRTTIKRLSKFGNFEWTKIFRLLFTGIDVEITAETPVVVKNTRYFKSCLVLLNKIGTKTFANYLLWYIVKEFSRETTNQMRRLNFKINEAIFGVKSDLTRRNECVMKVKEYFSFALLPEYLNNFTPPKTVPEVRSITKSIKVEFMKLLSRAEWLSHETRNMSMEKVRKIRHFIGHPEGFEVQANVDKYYKKVTITENHLRNLINLRTFKSFNNQLQILQSPRRSVKWPSNIFDVNAYYSVLQNAIFVPLGLLDEPFFHTRMTREKNYGALGSLLGHEIAHSLDNLGRQADSDGNIKNWWSKTDAQKYVSKAECFKNHQNFSGDENLALAENIADSVGLKLSHLAYKSLKKIDAELPNLSIYTVEQAFFISYAQMWCEISSDNDLFKLDEHSPVKRRVTRTISSNDNFKTNFNCDQPDNKCKIW